MSIMKELCFNSSSNNISGKMTVERVSKHAKTLIVKIDREKNTGEATNGAVVSQFDPEKKCYKAEMWQKHSEICVEYLIKSPMNPPWGNRNICHIVQYGRNL